MDVLSGTASFIDANTVKLSGPAGNETVTADNIVIAVGTKPAESPKVPVNGRTIVNSDQILELQELPKTLIVVGGG